jgi:hypothetical protein
MIRGVGNMCSLLQWTCRQVRESDTQRTRQGGLVFRTSCFCITVHLLRGG